jgi:broad specificity phosphatase PhoE
MELIFSTHGITVDNIAGILQGQRDGELSPFGISQAKELAGILKSTELNYIYTSPLKRCTDTAKEVAKYHPNARYIEDARLKARSLGIFEGKENSDELWDSLSGNYYTNRPKGGEMRIETWNRVSSFYEDELMGLEKNSNVYIVAHGETKIMLEGILRGFTIYETFRGHDGRKLLPRIAEPAKGELVYYSIKMK